MANKKQLDRLLAGVEGWNKWRQKNPHTQINLSTANLKGASLEDVDFRGANLMAADLRDTILNSADLTYTDLKEANFSRAKLVGADLRRSDLSDSFLIEADLSYADLNKAKLLGATISNMVIESTDFGEVDLSETKGFDNILFRGPSFISIGTLHNSKGKIPEKFLRGCGLSDWEIESAKLYQPGLSANQVTDISYKVCQLRTGNPIQYYSVFISYSSKDQDFVQCLYDALQNSGVRCWFAPEDLKIGDKFRGRIDDAIRVNDKFLIVLSENSINSAWVEKEVETAFEKENKGNGIVLFPIRLDDGVMKTDQAWAADIRRTRHIGDFMNWKDKDNYQKAFQRLLRDLKAARKEG